jgi:DNA-binding CsgD family transcriptional regulator
MTAMKHSDPPLPNWLPARFRDSAEAVLAARGHAGRLRHVIAQSRMPIVIVDQQRQYLEVNQPAELAFRLGANEMRKLRIDDLTPRDRLEEMGHLWRELLESGSVGGPYRVATPDGGEFEICFWAVANAVPGEHVIHFALPGGHTEPSDPAGERPSWPLTPREREVLQLAADGHSGPMIATELVLSPDTVRTHFANIYSKLAVSDRGGAVAKGIRLGLIE